MKGLWKKITSAVIIASVCFSMFACAVPELPSGPTGEKIDTTRTQIYVYSYNGGYGIDWLDAAKRRYEELHKDDVYEEGKKGVQIMIDANKDALSTIMASIKDNRNEIYFHEHASYYSYVNDGLLGDISDVFTEANTAYGDSEGRTVADKLSAEQLAFYGVQGNDGKTHYYGLPHTASYVGFVYNVDLFDERGYYFKRGYDRTDDMYDQFLGLTDKNGEKSYGPDGRTGIIDGVDYSLDDGLPETYDDFYMLCDYIRDDGVDPMVWSGKYYPQYFDWVLLQLFADYEGYEQSMLAYTFDGTAKNLGTALNGGGFEIDEDDTLIKQTNGYDVMRQAGRYYALDFIRNLMTHPEWVASGAFNNGFSHEDAQSAFLWAGQGVPGQGVESTREIAMLMEGVWWEMEASGIFSTMEASVGNEMSRNNRRFGFMPLPKANDAASDESTLIDTTGTLCFTRAGIAEWKKPLINDFLKFLYSDASLAEFTQIVDAPKALRYSMSEEQLNKMSPFGKSVMQLSAKSKTVYPVSKSAVFVNNESSFLNLYFSSKTSIGTIERPAQAFHDNPTLTTKDVFDGLRQYRIERIQWPKA